MRRSFCSFHNGQASLPHPIKLVSIGTCKRWRAGELAPERNTLQFSSDILDDGPRDITILQSLVEALHSVSTRIDIGVNEHHIVSRNDSKLILTGWELGKVAEDAVFIQPCAQESLESDVLRHAARPGVPHRPGGTQRVYPVLGAHGRCLATDCTTR